MGNIDWGEYVLEIKPNGRRKLCWQLDKALEDQPLTAREENESYDYVLFSKYFDVNTNCTFNRKTKTRIIRHGRPEKGGDTSNIILKILAFIIY